MTRNISTLLMILAAAAPALALAGTEGSPLSAPVTAKRQLINCMTRQMSASRTLSYNAASKLCKDQLKAQNDAVIAANTPRP